MRRELFPAIALTLTLLMLCLSGCAPEASLETTPAPSASNGAELPESGSSPAPLYTLKPVRSAQPTPPVPTVGPQTPEERMTADIEAFCKTHRLAGSPGELFALDTAAAVFASAGYRVQTQEVTQEGENAFSTHNVIGIRDAAAENAPILILNAHADSVEWGPGATDNAAGLAVLLECARQAAAFEGRAVEVRFIAFSAEEWQARGSRDYVASLTDAEKERILGVLTLDMFSSKNALLVFGYYESLGITYGFWERISAAAKENGTILGFDTPGVMMSDATPFEDAGIPSVLLTHMTVLDEYHTANDTPDRVSKERLLFALSLSLTLTKTLVNGG
ncbi:MAG: M20/M25/M40 family metallo-hydrolase [Bacillota bacterium]